MTGVSYGSSASVLRMSRPRVGALFAGYGGLDLAVEDVLAAEPA